MTVIYGNAKPPKKKEEHNKHFNATHSRSRMLAGQSPLCLGGKYNFAVVPARHSPRHSHTNEKRKKKESQRQIENKMDICVDMSNALLTVLET